MTGLFSPLQEEGLTELDPFWSHRCNLRSCTRVKFLCQYLHLILPGPSPDRQLIILVIHRLYVLLGTCLFLTSVFLKYCYTCGVQGSYYMVRSLCGPCAHIRKIITLFSLVSRTSCFVCRRPVFVRRWKCCVQQSLYRLRVSRDLTFLANR